LPQGFRPALSWKAEIAHVFPLQSGDAVSYGREYVADGPRLAAVIPVGYADGFPRRPQHWQHVLIHGCPAPILGRVCMDQTVIDVTDADAAHPVRAGDEVVLIGRAAHPRHDKPNEHAQISVDDVAARLGTINYDVVSRILARVPRVSVSHIIESAP
jgi:alanine racemase